MPAKNSSKPYLIYYVHHHGSGHTTMFRQLAPHLAARFSVIAITSDDEVKVKLKTASGNTYEVHQLPSKWTSDGPFDFVHTFSKAFEGVPHTTGATERVAWLAELFTKYRPAVFVSDVSAELVITAKSMGIPSVLVRLFGAFEHDPTQVFAYECADSILAPFSKEIDQQSYPYGTKTFYSGFISQFSGQSYDTSTYIHPNQAPVGILFGNDTMLDTTLRNITVNKNMQYTIVGSRSKLPDLGSNVTVHGRVPDIRPYLVGPVVIAAGGLNSTAELISMHKQLIIIPQSRPYDEQLYLARSLAAKNYAIEASESWLPEQWKQAIMEAARIDTERLDNLVNPTAGQDIARHLGNNYAN